MENNTEEKTRDPEHGDRVEWAGMIRPKSRGTVIWYGVKEGWDHPSVAVLWDHHPEGPLVHYKWIPGKGASWIRFLPVLDSLADPGPLASSPCHKSRPKPTGTT